MSYDIKLTMQEVRVVNYLQSRNGTDVAWEELAQFAKDPQNVKKKTIQKTISEIKRKYKSVGIDIPFNVNFVSLTSKAPVPLEQKLVQVRRTPGGHTMIIDSNTKLTAGQIDFALDFNYKRVRTKAGGHLLNDNEWDMMKYFWNNSERIIKISELRDKVSYPQYGSKLPARWFDAIMRVINNLRRAVPGLDIRIMTVKGIETSYIFQ